MSLRTWWVLQTDGIAARLEKFEQQLQRRRLVTEHLVAAQWRAFDASCSGTVH